MLEPPTREVLLELVHDELRQRAARLLGPLAKLGPVLRDELVERRLFRTATRVAVAALDWLGAIVASAKACKLSHTRAPAQGAGHEGESRNSARLAWLSPLAKLAKVAALPGPTQGRVHVLHALADFQRQQDRQRVARSR